MTTIYRVNGMTCGGCVDALRRAIMALAPEAKVEVDLAAGTAAVDGAEESSVRRAVANAGFDLAGRVGQPG